MIVPEHLSNLRLDKVIAALFGITRTKAQELVKTSNVTLNNKICTDASLKIRENDLLLITIPEQVKADILAADIPLDIVYEDNDVIVINKQAGLVVHPGAGNQDNTLVNALEFYYGDEKTDLSSTDRPGIVHRLDKDTSGLMIVAKNEAAHLHLAAQLADRSLSRTYCCIVWGMLPSMNGVIEARIGRQTKDRTKMQVMRFNGGKEAVTYYEIKEILRNGALSLVQCKLETGRTHQIRVHMSHIGHSILGDQTYGNNLRKILHANLPMVIKDQLREFKRQALHSISIKFIHPTTNKEMSFEVDLPKDIEDLVSLLRAPS
jgi:23S rRNA pseudouridine1911/1915/1917 synthase